jgi:hypothetical protein
MSIINPLLPIVLALLLITFLCSLFAWYKSQETKSVLAQYYSHYDIKRRSRKELSAFLVNVATGSHPDKTVVLRSLSDAILVTMQEEKKSEHMVRYRGGRMLKVEYFEPKTHR